MNSLVFRSSGTHSSAILVSTYCVNVTDPVYYISLTQPHRFEFTLNSPKACLVNEVLPTLPNKSTESPSSNDPWDSSVSFGRTNVQLKDYSIPDTKIVLQRNGTIEQSVVYFNFGEAIECPGQLCHEIESANVWRWWNDSSSRNNCQSLADLRYPTNLQGRTLTL